MKGGLNPQDQAKMYRMRADGMSDAEIDRALNTIPGTVAKFVTPKKKARKVGRPRVKKVDTPEPVKEVEPDFG